METCQVGSRARSNVLQHGTDILLSPFRYIILAGEWSLSWCLNYRLDERFIKKLDTWFPNLIAVVRRHLQPCGQWFISLRRFLNVDLAYKILQKCFRTAVKPRYSLLYVEATITHPAAAPHAPAMDMLDSQCQVTPICSAFKLSGISGVSANLTISLAERYRLAATYAGLLAEGTISMDVVCKSTSHLSRVLNQVSWLQINHEIFDRNHKATCIVVPTNLLPRSQSMCAPSHATSGH